MSVGGNHDNAAIGEALKRWRVQKGLSQTSVAKQMQHAGLRWYQTTVARVEKGERPLLIREAEPLAKILGHEASDLSAVLAGTEAPWADRDILDRLRVATFDSVTAEDLADAVAEIERLRATPEQIAQAIEAHAEGYGDPVDNAYEYVKIARQAVSES